MKTIYLYVLNNKVDDYLKYGIKLSEFADKVIKCDRGEKKGIVAYLSPKDSYLYYDNNYTCLKVKVDRLNIYIYNKATINLTKDKDFIRKISEYMVGSFEEPEVLICSSILPENLSIYNKLIDTPLLIDNSKEYYYKNSIYEMLDNDFFSNFEVYQLLLILGQKKGVLKVKEIDEKLKIYIDNKSNKKYTKKSNF